VNRRLTVDEIFARMKKRLSLTWEMGLSGGKRAVESDDATPSRPSLVGFLSLIHPNRIQVLGAEEIAYLDGLEARKNWEAVAEIIAQNPVACLVADNLVVPNDLALACDEAEIPLLTSPLPGQDLVSHLQYMVNDALAPRITLHGVFLEVFSIGVLITGESGAGKSELALELLSRGHRMVADDAPEFHLIAPDVLNGTCPALLQDCLEVRGLGILNIRQMFGDSAVKPNKYLRLIVHLQAADKRLIDQDIDRLHGDCSKRLVLGADVPVITIPVAPGRNLAVIVEAAVRNHALKMKGFDAGEAFMERHSAALAASGSK